MKFHCQFPVYVTGAKTDEHKAEENYHLKSGDQVVLLLNEDDLDPVTGIVDI